MNSPEDSPSVSIDPAKLRRSLVDLRLRLHSGSSAPPSTEQVRDPPTAKETKNRRRRLRSDNSVALALNAAAIVIAAAALWLSLDANELARRALSDQQIAGAWQILANKAPGATGKQYALGILLSPGANLQSLDLGCTRTLTANVLSKCQDSVDLSNLTLSGGDQSATLGAANLEGADLFRAHISDIEMLSVNMRNVDLSGALFERVSFRYVTFAGATIQLTTFRDVILEHVNFSHTNLSGLSVTATSAQYINVSGAVLCATSLECMDADRGVWNATYYFRDDPPKGLEFLPANIPTPSSCGSPTTNQDYIELICD